jgi:hypothetical protein
MATIIGPVYQPPADWGAEAVRKAVWEVQAAVTAAIVASTVAVSGGSG